MYGGSHIRYFTLNFAFISALFVAFTANLRLIFCLFSAYFRLILGHKSLSVGPQPRGHSAGRVAGPCTDTESHCTGTDRDAQGRFKGCSMYIYVCGVYVYAVCYTLFILYLYVSYICVCISVQCTVCYTLFIPYTLLSQALSAVSLHQSVFTIYPWRNPFLVGSVMLPILLHICVLYTPYLNTVFGLRPLSLLEWRVVIALSLPIVLVEEGLKVCIY